MNADLISMWNDINESHFSGALSPPVDIDWHELTGGEDSLEAFGIFMPRPWMIAIDRRFEFDPDLLKSGDEREMAKLEVVYRLVVHEMVHQSQYQHRLPGAGGHGASFIEVAAPVADSIGISKPTEEDASRWPDILPLLACHGL